MLHYNLKYQKARLTTALFLLSMGSASAYALSSFEYYSHPNDGQPIETITYDCENCHVITHPMSGRNSRPCTELECFETAIIPEKTKKFTGWKALKMLLEKRPMDVSQEPNQGFIDSIHLALAEPIRVCIEETGAYPHEIGLMQEVVSVSKIQMSNYQTAHKTLDNAINDIVSIMPAGIAEAELQRLKALKRQISQWQEIDTLEAYAEMFNNYQLMYDPGALTKHHLPYYFNGSLIWPNLE